MDKKEYISLREIIKHLEKEGITMIKSTLQFYEREGLIKPDQVVGDFKPIHVYKTKTIISRLKKIDRLKKEGYKLSAVKRKLD